MKCWEHGFEEVGLKTTSKGSRIDYYWIIFTLKTIHSNLLCEELTILLFFLNWWSFNILNLETLQKVSMSFCLVWPVIFISSSPVHSQWLPGLKIFSIKHLQPHGPPRDVPQGYPEELFTTEGQKHEFPCVCIPTVWVLAALSGNLGLGFTRTFLFHY